MRLVLKSVCVASVALLAGLPAFAERLTGQEVAALFSQGKISFVAGSEWATQSGNRYTLTHPSSSGETGTFRIFADGTVERHDERSNRKIRYHFDREADGTISAVYGNGSRYAIK